MAEETMKGIMTAVEDGVTKNFYPKTSYDMVEGLVPTIETTMQPIIRKREAHVADATVYPAGHMFIESDTGIVKYSDGEHAYVDLPNIPLSHELIKNFAAAVLNVMSPVRKTAAELEAENETYANGKPIICLDDMTLKIGDGTTAYNDLLNVGGKGGRVFDEMVSFQILQEDGTWA